MTPPLSQHAEEEALADWADGRPRHTAEKHAPDFSCCLPRLGVHANYRELYVEGNEALRVLLALNFLLANAAEAMDLRRKELRR